MLIHSPNFHMAVTLLLFFLTQIPRDILLYLYFKIISCRGNWYQGITSFRKQRFLSLIFVLLKLSPFLFHSLGVNYVITQTTQQSSSFNLCYLKHKACNDWWHFFYGRLDRDQSKFGFVVAVVDVFFHFALYIYFSLTVLYALVQIQFRIQVAIIDFTVYL